MGFADQIIAKAAGRLRVLAPPQSVSHGVFKNARRSNEEHSALLSQAQRLRGRVYLGDGAITGGDLDSLGRHRSPTDHLCWHILEIGPYGAVTGCARYRAHPGKESLSELDAGNAALAGDPQWGRAMSEAVRYEILESARTQRDFFEVSGWAISERVRFSESAFMIALATFALGRFLGGGRGIATATTRNHSSRMLQRLGGRPLECGEGALPQYFDPRFGCTMEIVAFDTMAPNPKYSRYVDGFLQQVPLLPLVFRDDESAGLAAAATAQPQWERAAA